jgi:hypothetical protein
VKSVDELLRWHKQLKDGVWPDAVPKPPLAKQNHDGLVTSPQSAIQGALTLLSAIVGRQTEVKQ